MIPAIALIAIGALSLGQATQVSSSQDIQTHLDSLIGKRKPGEKAVLDLAAFSKGAPIILQRSLEIKADNVEIRGGLILGGSLLSAKTAPLSSSLLNRLPQVARGKVVELNLSPDDPLFGFESRGFDLYEKLSHTELIAWTGSGQESLESARPLRPAQWPNPKGPEGGWQLTGDADENFTFTDQSRRPSRWNTTEGVWTYGYWQFDWADQTAPLKSYNRTTGKVSLEATEIGGLRRFGLVKGRRFAYINVLEELDEPGEFWLDVKDRRILAWLPVGVRQVVASSVSGPLIKAEKQSGLHLTNLTMVGGRGPGIELTDCRSSSVTASRLISQGGAGVLVNGGRAVSLKGLKITDSGEEGVRLTGGDRPSLTSSGHSIEDSVVQRVSRWCRTYRPAVLLEGVGARVSRCEFSDLPHQAILFQGNDFVIEKNDVKRVCTETSDSGAFYTGRNPTARGTIIRFNRFREMQVKAKTEGNHQFVISVYLDDCNSETLVQGNIFEGKCMGVLIGGGRDNRIEGNIFLNSEPPLIIDARAKGWTREFFDIHWGNHPELTAMPINSALWKMRYPELSKAAAIRYDLADPFGNTFVDNVALGGWEVTYYDKLDQKVWKRYEGNTLRKEPGTLDEALRLLPSRAARIPLSEIGPRR